MARSVLVCGLERDETGDQPTGDSLPVDAAPSGDRTWRVREEGLVREVIVLRQHDHLLHRTP
jgi:hypothetical protein